MARILVIEDDQRIRALVCDSLAGEGRNREAWQCLHTGLPKGIEPKIDLVENQECAQFLQFPKERDIGLHGGGGTIDQDQDQVQCQDQDQGHDLGQEDGRDDELASMAGIP